MPPEILLALAALGLFVLNRKGSTSTTEPAPLAGASTGSTTSAGDLLRQAFSVKPVSASTPALTTAAPAPAPATAPAPAYVESYSAPAPAPAPAPVQRTAYDRALANPASIPRMSGETQEQAVARVSGWASDQRTRIAGSNEIRSAWNATTPAENQLPLRTF